MGCFDCACCYDYDACCLEGESYCYLGRSGDSSVISVGVLMLTFFLMVLWTWSLRYISQTTRALRYPIPFPNPPIKVSSRLI